MKKKFYRIIRCNGIFRQSYFLKRNFRKANLGKTPYEAGGSVFFLRICFFTICSFAFALSGVWLVTSFWNRFSDHFSFALTHFRSLAILAACGPLYAGICLALILFFGSEQLKNMIS